MWKFVILFFGGLVATGTSENDTTTWEIKHGNVEARTKLFETLMRNYKREINPDHINLKFGVGALNVEIDEKRHSMEIDAMLRYVWSDSRLKWNEDEYNNVSVLRVPSENVWIPDLRLFNAANIFNPKTSCGESNVLIYPQGEVLWVPHCHLSSFCNVTNSPTPDQLQTCTLKFGSWTFDGFAMDLALYNDKSEVDLEDFNYVSNWKIESTSATRNEKKYPCCEEPFINLTFNLTIRRNS